MTITYSYRRKSSLKNKKENGWQTTSKKPQPQFINVDRADGHHPNRNRKHNNIECGGIGFKGDQGSVR